MSPTEITDTEVEQHKETIIRSKYDFDREDLDVFEPFELASLAGAIEDEIDQQMPTPRTNGDQTQHEKSRPVTQQDVERARMNSDQTSDSGLPFWLEGKGRSEKQVRTNEYQERRSDLTKQQADELRKLPPYKRQMALSSGTDEDVPEDVKRVRANMVRLNESRRSDSVLADVSAPRTNARSDRDTTDESDCIPVAGDRSGIVRDRFLDDEEDGE